MPPPSILPKHQRIILLGGHKRNGKNTAATLITVLLNKNNIPTTTLAFASRLKMEVAQAYGVSLVELEANKEFWRGVLQFWGNDYRKTYQKQPAYWVNYVIADIEQYSKFYPGSVILITDWRHLVESVELAKHYDVTKLWISRGIDSNSDKHSSENELSSKDADYHITNNSSIEHFESSLYTVLRGARIL